MRAVALRALVAALLLAQLVHSRRLAQTGGNDPNSFLGSTVTISGIAIIIGADYPTRKSDKIFAVDADGRRIHIKNADPADWSAIQLGERVVVTGEIIEVVPYEPPAAGGELPVEGGAAPPAAATPGNGNGNGNAWGRVKHVVKAVRGRSVKRASPRRPAPKEQLEFVRVEGAATTDAAALDASLAEPAPTRRRLQGVSFYNSGATTAVSSSFPTIDPEMRTLVVPIAGVTASGAACSGTTLPASTRQQLRATLFDTVDAVNPTVGSTFKKCSQGRTQFRETTSNVTERVNLPCSGTTNGAAWTFSKCDYDDFNGYADAALAALVSRGINVAAYKYKVFLIPPGQCSFVGLAYVGCDGSYDCRAWIGGGYWETPQNIAHELGHNLFMAHAGAYSTALPGWFDEYGDDSCVMGYCCQDRCPNGAHQWQMGWARTQFFNGTLLPSGQTVNLQLNSSSRYYNSAIRVRQTWVSNSDSLFLSFRTKHNGDAWLADNLAAKVHIYSAPISSQQDSDPTTWRAALAVGQAYSYPTTGLVVRRLANIDFDTAVVTLCRKGGTENAASCQGNYDNNCDGLSGAGDPACALFL